MRLGKWMVRVSILFYDFILLEELTHRSWPVSREIRAHFGFAPLGHVPPRMTRFYPTTAVTSLVSPLLAVARLPLPQVLGLKGYFCLFHSAFAWVLLLESFQAWVSILVVSGILPFDSAGRGGTRAGAVFSSL